MKHNSVQYWEQFYPLFIFMTIYFLYWAFELLEKKIKNK